MRTPWTIIRHLLFRSIPDENLLPNGMKREMSWILNPEPNLHLNIGQH